MKFLVMFEEDTAMSSNVPVPAMMEMVEATTHYMEDMKKKGKITDYGFYGVGHGGTAILNVGSHGELQEVTEMVPVRPICKIRSIPLVESNEFAPVFKKIKQQNLSLWEKMQSQR